YNLQILDIYGRSLLNRSNKINVGMNIIGVEKLNLASGEYTIRLISGSGISKYKKLHILN
ncbi:MAG: hypothetical protein M3Q95_01760, partial [Bacteroidota bacterium]|nr:hypothetical protein [Bacteroidota bacterium]